VIVGTLKQSIAAMASGWLRRKASQRLAGSSYPARNCSFGDFKTEHEKFSMDARRSPCGVSATIWKIRCRTSIDVCLVPNCSDGLLGFRNQRPVQTEPARCHRTTVLGVTTMSACLHSDQNRRTATQKSLSSKSSLGRGCRRFRTVSCCQSARFSRTRFRRLRQRRMSAPDAEVEHATELYQINGWGGWL
jgi:hypothetical protein